MRGQIVWVAQEGDAATGRPARAVAVEYDAARAVTREAQEGVLIVTNQNHTFNGAVPAHLMCGRYARIAELIRAMTGRLTAADALMLSNGVANMSTLHSVQVHPAGRGFEVWFRRGWSMPQRPVRYEMP